MENKKECFIAHLEGETYVIPTELRDKFDGTDYYDRIKVFSIYVLLDDAIFESVFVDDYDLQCLVDGDFG